MRLQGALITHSLDWCGDVIINAPEPGTLQLSMTIQADSLRDFLDQFQDFSLTVLPNDGIE
jgi:hypothetical protein